MKSFKFLLVVIVLAALLAACGSSGPETVEVTIEMTEYAFSPADLEFQVGQEVTLTLINVGQLDHEIMFGRDVMITDGHPDGYMVDFFEEAGVEPMVMSVEDDHDDDDGDDHGDGDDHDDDDMGHTGFMVFVPVGDDTYEIQFTVTEEMIGDWEIGCFEAVGVHYEQGMVGTMTITP